MHGANKLFLSQKAKWLKNNLIVYKARASSRNPWNDPKKNIDQTLNIRTFDLREIGVIHGVNPSNKKEYGLFRMEDDIVIPGGVGDSKTNAKQRKTGIFTHPIRAYFLPFQAGDTWCGMLGNEADLFFTPTLSGCTFAYSPNGSNARVAHSNSLVKNSSTSSTIDQNAIDISITQTFQTHNAVSCLIKENYDRADADQGAYRVTIVGIREGNEWLFYYQHYVIRQTGTKMVDVSNEIISIRKSMYVEPSSW